MSVHEKRPMKRSRAVVLTTLSAAGVAALSACGSDDDVDAFPYATVAECRSAGDVPASECDRAYQQALANHELSAPRFDSQSLCEEQFGNNGCQQGVTNGNSFWMPLLAGFMVGRMLDNDRSYYRYSSLYRHRNHGWYAGGSYGGPLYRSGGRYRSGMSAFDRPSHASPINTRSSIASRGGFGSRSRSSFGG